MTKELVMKVRWCFLVTVFVGLIFVAGCVSPPEGTMFVDLEGNGIEVLVQDADKDGVPDVDAAGNVIPVSYGVYKGADIVDSTVPTVLGAIGTIFGAPLLVGVGAWWHKARAGRLVANLIASVQAGRAKLKTQTNGEVLLEAFDKALEDIQDPQTILLVKELKIRLGLEKVT